MRDHERGAFQERPQRISRVEGAQLAIWQRKTCHVERPVSRAPLYASALGYCGLCLDGQGISDRVRDPGQTDHPSDGYMLENGATTLCENPGRWDPGLRTYPSVKEMPPRDLD